MSYIGYLSALRECVQRLGEKAEEVEELLQEAQHCLNTSSSLNYKNSPTDCTDIFSPPDYFFADTAEANSRVDFERSHNPT